MLYVIPCKTSALRRFCSCVYYYIMSIILWTHIHFMRKSFLKISGMQIGNFTRCSRNLDIRNPWNIKIGDDCILNKEILLDGRGGKLIIGNSVDIAQEVQIWTLTHDINDSCHAPIGSGVIIEDYSWIGTRSIIMPGVIIGKGAVVAAGAVVTKNVAPMTVVAGVPAKVISIRSNPLTYNLHSIF